MKEPKVSMLVALSALSSGVPVKPMNMASGSSCFMARCILPDWVRWASSTKTKKLPLALKSFGIVALSSCDEVLARLVARRRRRREPRNLCTSEQISHSAGLVEGVEQVGAAAWCGRSAR